MLASCPASMLNQIRPTLGIPFDSFPSHPALGYADYDAKAKPFIVED